MVTPKGRRGEEGGGGQVSQSVATRATCPSTKKLLA